MNRAWIVAAGGWLVWLGWGLMLAAQAQEQKVAVVVGVNKYLKPGFSDLKYAEKDAEEVGKVLGQQGFKVTALMGSASGSLQATRENVLAAIKQAVRPLGKQDVMLVMLAGHGVQFEVVKTGEKKDDAFFCPVDGVKNDAETLVSLSHVIDDLLAPNVGTKLVLVDACRDVPSDPGRGGRGIQGKVISLPEDTAVLFSCRAGQRSFEHSKLGHGLFTYCVLEGLRGQAARNGEVTWQHLVAHVADRMATEEFKDFSQEPINAGGVARKVLARISTNTVPPPVIPPKVEPVPPANGDRFAGSRSGQEWDGNGLKMKFCWCPAGKFTMGSPATEKDRNPDRETQVSVTLTQGFWLGKYEVTQGEWERVMGSTLKEQRDKTDKSWGLYGEGSRYPMYYVNHDEALDYCRKLTAQEKQAGRLPSGWEYRLPTEAQWEYACRAGTTTATAYGDRLSSTQANFDGDYPYPYNGAEKGPDLGGTSEVGRYASNAWGLHDMHGNVYEWCADWYGGKLAGGTDPVGAASSSHRVNRGGGWYDLGQDCRSADRNRHAPDYRYSNLGFRAALVPSGK